MKKCCYYEYDNVPQPNLCPCGMSTGYGQNAECHMNEKNMQKQGFPTYCPWKRPPDRQMSMEGM